MSTEYSNGQGKKVDNLYQPPTIQKVIQFVFKAIPINAINNIFIHIIPEIHHPKNIFYED